jgi:hypothetical protein
VLGHGFVSFISLLEPEGDGYGHGQEAWVSFDFLAPMVTIHPIVTTIRNECFQNETPQTNA